jgi:hypothetical protein
MIIGMLPMALGLGEGGSRTRHSALSVDGGLMLATVATPLFPACGIRPVAPISSQQCQGRTEEMFIL